MSLTHINFTWTFYYCLLAAVTLWICGLTAITQKGKIGYFFRRFFEKKKPVTMYFPDQANLKLDEDLKTALAAFNIYAYAKLPVEDREKLHLEVCKFMTVNNIYSEDNEFNILIKLAAPSEQVHNEYHYFKDVPVLPSYITDPIITCITCMSSVHSLVIYTGVSMFLNFYWNPLEWAALAVPAAFTGEFFWKLKKLIAKEN